MGLFGSLVDLVADVATVVVAPVEVAVDVAAAVVKPVAAGASAIVDEVKNLTR